MSGTGGTGNRGVKKTLLLSAANISLKLLIIILPGRQQQEPMAAFHRYHPALQAAHFHLVFEITQIDYGSADHKSYAAPRVAKFILDQPNDSRSLRLACRPLAAPHNYCPYMPFSSS